MNPRQLKINRPIFSRRRAGNYEVLAKENEADILIYDEISPWGINAERFVRDLQAIDAKTINVRINSPGGNVFDGAAMFNALKKKKAKIITHVDGIAASYASVLAMAGEEVHMAKNAFMMIHDPWTIAIGDAAEMRKQAEILDKIGEVIARNYADKTGAQMDEIRALMEEETWFTAEEAKEIGLVDIIDDEQEANDSVAAMFDLSIFNNTPENLKNLSSETLDKSQLENVLRDAGCTRRQAKAILAEGFDAISPRDASADEMPETSKAIAELSSHIRGMIN
jgi:ATP-dependent Clp endopeptidase proteolytic subunit ClpP